MFAGFQLGVIAQDQRQRNEGRGQDQMQREDTEIEAHQFRVEQNPAEVIGLRLCVAVEARHRRCRHRGVQQQQAQAGESRNDPEQTRYADPTRQHGARHHRQRERQADTDADQRHGLGAVLFPGEVRGQRHHDARHRSRALQRAAGDDAIDRVAEGGQYAAGREQQQADGNQRLTSVAIGPAAKGDLQDGLRESVGADREADQKGTRIRQVARIDREHRKNHEQAEHATHVNAGQRDAGAQFGRRHRGIEFELGLHAREFCFAVSCLRIVSGYPPSLNLTWTRFRSAAPALTI